MNLRLALLFVCAVPALADSVAWNITTIAQNGSVVGGYTLTNLANSGLADIAPDNNFVAYTSNYTSPSNFGIFGSDGSVIAYQGEVIGGHAIGVSLVSPLVNDSDTVLFGNGAGFFTATSYLAGMVDGETPYRPFGLENDGAFLGSFGSSGNGNPYLGNASNSKLYPNEGAGQLNNNGEGVQTGGTNTIYDLQGDVIAQIGTVIDGDTLSYFTNAASINDSGTIAFVAYYNDNSACGIFTQTSLAVALPHSECNTTDVNINNSGALAWFVEGGSIYTQDGLVTDTAASPFNGLIGNRFFNNLGSLTWISTSGQVELATEVVASTPEPGTFWLGLGVAVIVGIAMARRRVVTRRDAR